MHIIDILEHVLLCSNLLFDGNFAKNSIEKNILGKNLKEKLAIDHKSFLGQSEVSIALIVDFVSIIHRFLMPNPCIL